MTEGTLTQTSIEDVRKEGAALAAPKRVGDRVRIATWVGGQWAGRLGTVNKVNPKTIVLDVDGSTRGLRIDPSYCTVVTGDEAKPQPTVVGVPYVALDPRITLGAIVKTKTPNPKIPGFYVVVKTGDEKVNIARLGGEDGRYWRINPRVLEALTAEQVAAFVKGGEAAL